MSDTSSATQREGLAPDGLPTWEECRLRICSEEWCRKHGHEQQTPLPTELHRFIYEYEDADPVRATAFRENLKKLLAVSETGIAPEDGPLSYPRLLAHVKKLGETLADERSALAFFMATAFADGYFDDEGDQALKERVRAWLLDSANRIRDDITVQEVVEGILND